MGEIARDTGARSAILAPMDQLSPPLPGAATGPVIIYDGECPVCTRYVRMARLREAAGEVTLVNARERDHPRVAEVRARGLDLNEGMVVLLDGQMHYGSDAMVVLSALSTRSGLFNRMMRVAFASPRRARWLYPVLVRGRLLLLRLLGRRPIED